MNFNYPTIKVLVLPGGRMPEAARIGEDVGYDAFVRAIVSNEIDPLTHGHKTLWDFGNTFHPSIASYIKTNDGELSYALLPGHSVTVGYGVIFGMTNKWFSITVPRSNTSKKDLDCNQEYYKDLLNFVPVDPGYRGEPSGRIVNLTKNPEKIIYIKKNWRPAQFVFLREYQKGLHPNFVRPKLVQVHSYKELGNSKRGIQCNGSSGTNGSYHDITQLTLNL